MTGWQWQYCMSSSNEISFTQLSVIEFQTSTHLQWIVYPAASPARQQPTQWEDSLYVCLSLWYRESFLCKGCQNRQRCSLRSAPSILGLVLMVPSAGTCQVLWYSCSPRHVWLRSHLRQDRSNCRNVFSVRITLSAASGCFFLEMKWKNIICQYFSFFYCNSSRFRSFCYLKF